MNSIATFDLLVLGALSVGALIGIIVGLLRASLLALSWAGAAVIMSPQCRRVRRSHPTCREE